MLRTRTLAAMVLIGLMAPPALRGEDGAAPVEAKAVLERLKGLAGTWTFVGAPEDGEDTAGAKVVYRVTAAGSAVVEDQFPGSDHEMVSIYHLDGDDLVMTHYCAAGNQPRMRLDRERSTLDEIHFAFDGGTNFDPDRDMHIHEAVLHLGGTAGGRLTSEWTAYMDGKAMGTTTFTLARE